MDRKAIITLATSIVEVLTEAKKRKRKRRKKGKALPSSSIWYMDYDVSDGGSGGEG